MPLLMPIYKYYVKYKIYQYQHLLGCGNHKGLNALNGIILNSLVFLIFIFIFTFTFSKHFILRLAAAPDVRNLIYTSERKRNLAEAVQTTETWRY